MTIWTTNATRQDLLALVQGERLGHRPGYIQQIALPSKIGLVRPGEYQLLWSDDPNKWQSLPRAIVVSDKERRDFLAWAVTYLPSVRPFTAFCRVLDTATLGRVLKRTRPPWLGRFEDACVGLVITEAAAYLADRRDVRQTALISFASVYSFAMARALALDLLDRDSDMISGAWSAARRATRQGESLLSLQQLKEPWAVLLSLQNDAYIPPETAVGRPRREIVQTCLELQQKGDISSNMWSKLSEEYPELSNVKEEMRGPREQRVLAFELALSVIASRPVRTSGLSEFICGYLASEIGPGSLDHLSLLVPHIHSVPSALLWYGLCAGLRMGSNLQNYAGGLGRRITRDLLQSGDWLDVPRCDIAVAELEMLTDSEGAPLDLRTSSSGHLLVELAPAVITILKWPPPSDVSEELFPKSTSAASVESQRTASEVSDIIAQLGFLQSRLARVFSASDAGRFGRRRRK